MSTLLEQVRSLAGSPPTTEISDAEITDALARNGDNVYFAAAEILETRAALAAPQAVSKSIGGTYNYSGLKIPEHYLALAERLRKTAAEVNPAFDAAEWNVGPVVEEQIVENAILRGLGE